MQIFRSLDELVNNTQRSVVSVGNFDGVHLGHQLVLKSMVDRARELSAQSAVVTFDPLGPDAVKRIARRELESVARRHGLIGWTILWSERLIEHVSQSGWDARYGARPLQRTIEREVVAPLAAWRLKQAPDSASTLLVDWMDGELRASKV